MIELAEHIIPAQYISNKFLLISSGEFFKGDLFLFIKEQFLWAKYGKWYRYVVVR